MSVEAGPPINQGPLSQKEVAGMVGLTCGMPMQAQTRPPFLQGRTTESIVMVELL